MVMAGVVVSGVRVMLATDHVLSLLVVAVLVGVQGLVLRLGSVGVAATNTCGRAIRCGGRCRRNARAGRRGAALVVGARL